MTQYEFRVMDLSNGERPHEWENRLDVMGEDGWQVVGVVSIPVNTRIILQRELWGIRR